MTFFKRAGAATVGAVALMTLAGTAANAADSIEPLGTHRVGYYKTSSACNSARIKYLHAGYKVSTSCKGSAPKFYFEYYTF